jgi:PAS domain-containing protein
MCSPAPLPPAPDNQPTTSTDHIAALQCALDAAQQQVRHHAELLDTLPGMANQFVLSPDGQGRFTYVSAGVRALYGIEPAAVYANPTALVEALTEESKALLERSFAEALRELTPWQWKLL